MFWAHMLHAMTMLTNAALRMKQVDVTLCDISYTLQICSATSHLQAAVSVRCRLLHRL